MNWVNYSSVLAQLQASGLQVESITADDIGKRRRCRVEGDKEKRGWYHLHELRTDAGNTLLVGSFGVWRGNDNGAQKVQLDKANVLTNEQRQALRDRIAEDQRREDARRRAEGERAGRRAAAMWSRLSEAGHCDYLERKQVQAFGVRFSDKGAMVIPMLDVHGEIHGLQLIFPKGHPRAKRLERDKDFWPAGLVKQAHFFLIGSPAGAAALLIAEGYATAASLHMATGLPCAVAFDAGNLLHVAKALAARYRGTKVVICADDDYLGKCRACGKLTSTSSATCDHCGAESRVRNAGVSDGQAAALAVDGSWLVPWFASERPRDSKGPTDFNDLHVLQGLHTVRSQVEAHLSAQTWWGERENAARNSTIREGEGDDLYVLTTVSQLTSRFAIVFEMTDTVFDAEEHKLVPLSSMRNICCSRDLHRRWMESIDKRIVRVSEVGFDPTERDAKVKCNLWGGWPTTPAAGDCRRLLELGQYLCSDDPRGSELWAWVLKWLAYPIQHPGAKMKTALVVHGPQGTGKNVFFEAYMSIYGEYAKVIDQEAIEDKFNEGFSRKLFIVADEVVARQELYHTKNKLKGMVTGTEMRINPKNVGAYFEKNHLNLVFLSNEPQPMVLERDDRRYCVIWTPPKLEAAEYHAIMAEIAAGGVEALHEHLLHLDLGDFGPATLPPMTRAKEDLIELSLDNSDQFWNEWVRKELPLPVNPVRSEDLYDAYRHWCGKQGVNKPAQQKTFVGALSKRQGVQKTRVRHFLNYSRTVMVQSTVLWPPGADRDASIEELSDQLARFTGELIKWKRPAKEEGGSRGNKAEVGDEF